jgi:amino acid transporter
VTRAIGPQSGWITGWAICVTGILVVGSLADVAAYSFYDLVGAESLVENTAAVTLLALALIAVMTTVCVLGTELSAHLQKALMILQIGPLLLVVAVVLYKVLAGDAPSAAVDPSLSWFNPFAIESGGALTERCCSASSSTGVGRAPSTSTRRPSTRSPRRGWPV